MLENALQCTRVWDRTTISIFFFLWGAGCVRVCCHVRPARKVFYLYMSEEPDDFQSALVTRPTIACWLAGNRLRYFLAVILSLRGKLGCAVRKLLEVAPDILSLLTASHQYRFRDDFQSSQLSMFKQHLCWLPVITIVPMMTSSQYYCSHDDFQSSQLCPSTLKQHMCWLPVIMIVSRMTSNHHNNVTGGIPCEKPISVQWLAVTSHSCWLEVIGLLVHVMYDYE